MLRQFSLKNKRLIILGLLIGLFLQLLPLSGWSGKINRADALAVTVIGGLVNTFETNPSLVASETITAAQTAAETTQTLFEYAESFILSSLKKRLLDMIVDQIVVWVQGGGEPKFVTDWSGFLKDFANVAVGDFVEELGLGFLCSPFNFQIQLLLAPVPRFSQQVTCTLDQIVGNIENFYNDFRNGSWIAYSTMWQPQNNFFGAYIMTSIERDRRVADAQFAAWSEGIAGGGYLGVRGEDGEIATPGHAVGAAVAEAIGSDIGFILEADQLEDYVAAIADAFINRLIISGVNGLRGVSTPSAPSGGGISPGVTGPCAGLTGAALTSCLQYRQTFGESFASARAHMLSQIDLESDPRNRAQNLINESIDLQNQILSSLAQLKQCHQSKAQTSQANETQQRIENEQRNLAALQTLRVDNQNRIGFLQSQKGSFNSLAEGDWVGLTAALNGVSGQLNPVAAVSFEDARKTERDDTRARLDQARQDLNQCQS